MQATRATGALHGSLLTLDKDYFIPAHHVVSVSIENSDLCTAGVETEACYDTHFKDQSEIVLFDEPQKYEIRIPVPPFTRPNPNETGVPLQTK